MLKVKNADIICHELTPLIQKIVKNSGKLIKIVENT